MRGKQLTDEQVAHYTDLRRGGRRQVQAIQLTGISKRSAIRIEQTEAFQKAMAEAPSRPATPPRFVPQLTPDQTRELEALRAKAALEEELANQPDVVGGVEVVKDSPKGRIEEASSEIPSFGYGTPDPDASHGLRSDPTPPEGYGPDGMPKRTWSPDDRHLAPNDPDLIAAERLAEHYGVVNAHLAE